MTQEFAGAGLTNSSLDLPAAGGPGYQMFTTENQIQNDSNMLNKQ